MRCALRRAVSVVNPLLRKPARTGSTERGCQPCSLDNLRWRAEFRLRSSARGAGAGTAGSPGRRRWISAGSPVSGPCGKPGRQARPRPEQEAAGSGLYPQVPQVRAFSFSLDEQAACCVIDRAGPQRRAKGRRPCVLSWLALGVHLAGGPWLFAEWRSVIRHRIVVVVVSTRIRRWDWTGAAARASASGMLGPSSRR